MAQQYELNLRDFWHIVRKRRGIIVFTALLVLAFTLILTQFLNPKPLYETTASVKYDRTSTLTGLYLDILTYSPTDVMATQTVVIKSYPVMEKVAKKLGLVPQDFSTAMITEMSRPTALSTIEEEPTTQTITEKMPADTPVPEDASLQEQTKELIIGTDEPPAEPARHVAMIQAEQMGDDLRVIIQGNGAFEPDVFDVGREMVVVDLPGTIYMGTQKRIPVDNAVVKQIRVDQRVDPKMVRVVLDLDNASPYTIQQDGTAVIIHFEKGAYETAEETTALEEAAVMTEEKMVASPKDEVESTAPRDPQNAASYLKTIFALQESITTQQEGTTNIIRITATASDAHRAARLANTVAETYREENIETRNREVRAAQKFIGSQIQLYAKRLRQTEQKLRAFKEREQRVFLTDEAKLLLTNLTHLETQYEKVKRTVGETRAQLAELQTQSFLAERPSERIFTEEASALIFTLNSNLLSLIQERDTLLINYTSEHLQVKELHNKILNVKNEMMRELTGKIEAYGDRETVLQRQIDQHKLDYLKVPSTALKVARLEREVKINEETYSLLKSKHEEAMIKAAEQIEEVTIIAPAFPPAQPVNAPKTAMNVAVGGMMGLLLGIVAAFTRESLDTSLGTIEDTEEFLGTSVLGVIPTVDTAKIKEAIEKEQRREDRRKQDPSTYTGVERRIGPRRIHTKTETYMKLISLFAPQSPIAEAYRAVRTNIAFATTGQDFKILQFSSAGLSEGKTTTTINVAITMAQIGKRVLIVDADLRQPTIHHAFGLPKEPGLTEILLGSHTWQEATRTVSDLMVGSLGIDEIIGSPGIDKISIITSGSIPPHPAECINSPKIATLFREWRDQFDLVIVDTPPILPVADAVILGSKTDGVILVYQVGQVPRMVLKRAKHLLDKSKAKVLGVVLNNVPAEVSPDYSYQSYRYSSYPSTTNDEEGAPTKPSRWSFLTHLFRK